MKNALRWIALLPGAFLAMIIVNAINSLTVGMTLPDAVDQISKACFGSWAFVLAAYYIAPRGKVVTAIVVATAYCSIGSFAVALNLRSGQPDHPAWLEITTTLISIVASISACIAAACLAKEPANAELLNKLQDE